MMLRTHVCSYPIIVSHLSFNFLCLLLLYSIYLNGLHILNIGKGWEGGGGQREGTVEGQQYTSIVPSSMGAKVHKLGRKYKP